MLERRKGRRHSTATDWLSAEITAVGPDGSRQRNDTWWPMYGVREPIRVRENVALDACDDRREVGALLGHRPVEPRGDLVR
jgi:hypothetical protein